MAERPRMALIDGSSYIYRAYHALPKLSNSKGAPTGAVYGFAQMLKKVLKDMRADHVAVVFDPPGGSFRDKIYPEYKATRQAMPEDLVPQIPVIKEMIKLWNIPTVEVEGYEADDVIGAIAKKAGSEFDVMVVTSDKDFCQIVDEHVKLVDTMKDRVTGIEQVKERFGVGPEGVIEVLGLAGDTSDNVPGVPGIGEKTARELIEKYGSIEGVLSHIDEIPGKKRQENLREYGQQALLSRKLVTLDTDVPVGVDPKDLQPGKPDAAAMRKFLREMEFVTLLELFEAPDEEIAPSKKAEKNYHLVTAQKEFDALLSKLKKADWISFDTETSSTDPMVAELVGISFCVKEGEAYYIPLRHRYLGVPDQLDLDEVIKSLKPIFQDRNRKLVAQNAKYDMAVLAFHGLSIPEVDFDTMVAGYVLNPARRRQNLELLAQEYLDVSMTSYSDVVGKGAKEKPFDQVTVEEARDYSCEDAAVTFSLRRVLEKKLHEADQWNIFSDLEMPLVPVLMRMEMNGVRIDAKLLGKISSEIERDLDALLKKLHKTAGVEFNPNSPKQLADVLFDVIGLKSVRKTKTGRSTDQDVLEELALVHPLPAMVLEYRSQSKLKGTYTDTLPTLVNPKTGRIHTRFNQTVTSTGRLSSSDPNLQNIPIRSDLGKRIREAFVPDPGHLLISADYSQIELRIMAHLSGDKTLLDSFKKDQDIHRRTAAELYGVPPEEVTPDQRREAKVVNFGIAYGMSAYGLSQQLRIPREEAQKIHDAYFARYPGVKKYIERNLEEARKKGYVLTCLGRKLRLPDINSKNHNVRANAERSAINAPMQGTAADIIKDAMIRVQKFLDKEHPKTRMILQVHDELLFETPEKDVPVVEKAVKKIMESEMKLEVPITIDVGHGANWAEAH